MKDWFWLCINLLKQKMFYVKANLINMPLSSKVLTMLGKPAMPSFLHTKKNSGIKSFHRWLSIK